MERKNLLILLDQGLGDNIACLPSFNVLMNQGICCNIILLGTKNAIQVFDGMPIHAKYEIIYRRNIIHTIKNLKSACEFIKKHKIDEFFSIIPAKQNVALALLLCVFNPFYIRKKTYNTLLMWLMKLTSKMPDGSASVFPKVAKKMFEHYSRRILNTFPECFHGCEVIISEPRLPAKKCLTYLTIGVHACTSRLRLRYPVELYADVVFKIAVKNNYQIAIFSGNKIEESIGNKIKQRLILLGFNEADITLFKPMAFKDFTNHIASLEVFLCNDSGPMHVAAAVQTPIIAYPAPLKKSITPKWLPAMDDARYIVFTRSDIGMPNNGFIRFLCKAFILTYKPKNINEITETVFHKVCNKGIIKDR